MNVRNTLGALAVLFAIGCGSTSITGSSDKGTEEQQRAAQQKADDDERQEIKNRKAKNVQQKP